MSFSKRIAIAAVATFVVTVPVCLQQANAQSDTIKRTPLQKFEVPNSNYGAVIGKAEIVPDVLVGRHTHPGPESGYIIEGSFTLYVDGEEPRVLNAGDSYLVPANVIHDAKTGPDGATVIATYIVENGQPLASPAN